MFDKIFVSPQVKRIMIISNKHGIYVLPHGLPNDLRLLKTSKNYSLAPSPHPPPKKKKIQILSILAKNS